MTDEEAIRALHDAWLAAEIAGRNEDLLRLCDPAVVLEPPGAPPVVGIPAVRAFLAADAGGIARIDILRLEIRVEGDRARKTARFVTWPAGAAAPVRGRHVWELRRPWRVCRVSWTLDG